MTAASAPRTQSVRREGGLLAVLQEPAAVQLLEEDAAVLDVLQPDVAGHVFDPDELAALARVRRRRSW